RTGRSRPRMGSGSIPKLTASSASASPGRCGRSDPAEGPAVSESSPCQVDEPFAVRRAARGEVGLFFDWAKGEGWNPGMHDAPGCDDADPEGMLVGELHGEPVACISCVRYGEGFGFVGQYIVKPEHRGRGLGLRLWTAGLARLAGRNVGLDGVLDQVPNYE